MDHVKKAMELADKEFGTYPMWLCPLRHRVPKGMEGLSIFNKDDLEVDIGAYGYSFLDKKVRTNIYINLFIL